MFRVLCCRCLLSALPLVALSCSSSTGTDNQAPHLSIVAPSPGAVYLRGDTVDIQVTASDDDGAVTRVRFYVDGAYLGVDSTSPYLFGWDTRQVAVSEHTLRVVVEDDDGALASGEVELRVGWRYFQPEETGDGWETATLAAEGFDTSSLDEGMDQLYAAGYDDFLHAILVARNGKLVFEEYFRGFRRDSLNHVQSTTKSFTSALVGIAIDKGYIGGVDEPFFDYLPRYAHLRDADKDGITLEHLLTMTPGLEWNEGSVPTLDDSNDNMIGNRGDDYVAYALAKPVVAEPGTAWWYNSGCSMTLGEIVRSATGRSADVFAEQHLFGPLGITDYYWPLMAGGHVSTHGGLYVRPRDMAKFGQLYLQQGVWNSEQVISEEWVTASTQPYITIWGGIQYGYQWWFEVVHGYDVPYTSGYGGQHIFVVPALGMVVVTAADYSNSGAIGRQTGMIMELFKDGILPAAQPLAAR